MSKAEIGVFGGSGFYSLLKDVREVKVDTPYGPPSDSLMLATVNGRNVAFLPRHGRNHTIPPHKINYRANVHALKRIGVEQVLLKGGVQQFDQLVAILGLPEEHRGQALKQRALGGVIHG